MSAEFSYTITEISGKWIRIKVSTPVTPTRSYHLSWDGDQLREGSHTRALRERAPEVMSALVVRLGEVWDQAQMAAAIQRLNREANTIDAEIGSLEEAYRFIKGQEDYWRRAYKREANLAHQLHQCLQSVQDQTFCTSTKELVSAELIRLNQYFPASLPINCGDGCNGCDYCRRSADADTTEIVAPQ